MTPLPALAIAKGDENLMLATKLHHLHWCRSAQISALIKKEDNENHFGASLF